MRGLKRSTLVGLANNQTIREKKKENEKENVFLVRLFQTKHTTDKQNEEERKNDLYLVLSECRKRPRIVVVKQRTNCQQLFPSCCWQAETSPLFIQKINKWKGFMSLFLALPNFKASKRCCVWFRTLPVKLVLYVICCDSAWRSLTLYLGLFIKQDPMFICSANQVRTCICSRMTSWSDRGSKSLGSKQKACKCSRA